MSGAAPKPTEIQLSIRTSDDSFESRLSFPVDFNASQIQSVMAGWLQALQAGLDIARTGEKS